MSRWFRLYDDILDDPKVQMLSPELFKTWVNILAVASKHAGKIPPIQPLAFSLRLSQQDMQSRVEDLIIAGLIDIMPDKSLEPHNWSKRQWKSDDSAERVKRHRDKKRAETPGNTEQAVTETKCNDSVTVTVTRPDTDTDTDNNPLGDARGRSREEIAEANRLAAEAYELGLKNKGSMVAKSARAVASVQGELDGSMGIRFSDGKLEITGNAVVELAKDFPDVHLEAVCNKAGPELAKLRWPSRSDAMTVLRKWAQIELERGFGRPKQVSGSGSAPNWLEQKNEKARALMRRAVANEVPA